MYWCVCCSEDMKLYQIGSSIGGTVYFTYTAERSCLYKSVCVCVSVCVSLVFGCVRVTVCAASTTHIACNGNVRLQTGTRQRAHEGVVFHCMVGVHNVCACVLIALLHTNRKGWIITASILSIWGCFLCDFQALTCSIFVYPRPAHIR